MLPSLKTAATYSPALRRSTIGARGLNFSVRDGKRWNPTAIATWFVSFRMANIWVICLAICCWHVVGKRNLSVCCRANHCCHASRLYSIRLSRLSSEKGNRRPKVCARRGKADGLLVWLGFDVTASTPATYQRHRLWRPCETSSCGRLRA